MALDAELPPVGLTGLYPRISVDKQVPIRGASRHGGDGGESAPGNGRACDCAESDCRCAKEPRWLFEWKILDRGP